MRFVRIPHHVFMPFSDLASVIIVLDTTWMAGIKLGGMDEKRFKNRSCVVASSKNSIEVYRLTRHERIGYPPDHLSRHGLNLSSSWCFSFGGVISLNAYGAFRICDVNYFNLPLRSRV